MLSETYESLSSRASTPDNDIFADLHQSGMTDDLLWLAPGKESLATSEAAVLLGKRVVTLVRGSYFKWQTMGVVGMSLSEQIFPMHVDMDCFELETMPQITVEDQEQVRLTTKLQVSFEADPLEDGINHPAELVIAEALGSKEEHRVLNWLSTLSLDADHPGFAASVLRCLGRQDHPGTSSWRVALVREGLATDDVEIRDAAAQVAELWGDLELIEVLQSHFETEPWLRDYIQDIIDNLQE